MFSKIKKPENTTKLGQLQPYAKSKQGPMKAYKIYTVTAFLGLILAGCSSLEAPQSGSGVYFQPNQKPQSRTVQNADPEQTQQSEASKSTKPPKQPSERNPRSQYAAQQKADADTETPAREYDYFPENRKSQPAYTGDNGYTSYQYTNQIRRFESDLSFGYFDPFYTRSSWGYDPYYPNRVFHRRGFSAGLAFGNTGFYSNRFDPYFGRFYQPFGYRQGFRDGFFGGQYGLHSPFASRGFGFANYGFYNPYRYPASDQNNSRDNTINQPRNPMGSNFDTDKERDNSRRRSKKTSPRGSNNSSDNQPPKRRQYDYYQPDQNRNKQADEQKPQRRQRSNYQERNRGTDSNPFSSPTRSNDRQLQDPGRQQNQFNRQNRPNDNSRQRSPSRGNRSRGNNNSDSDNSMNRPRR